MWKLILLVLFTLAPKITQAQTTDPELQSPYANRCGECGDMDKYIYSHTGHFCHPEDRNAMNKNFTQTESKHTKCVPTIYDVRYPIRQFCCFWSPQLGCGILIGEKYYDKYGRSCAPCLHHCPLAKNYGSRPTIPLAMPFLALLQMLIPLNQLG